ncbi:MAG: hypothetical protein ACE14M_10095 [Terriglobales bacterium]
MTAQQEKSQQESPATAREIPGLPGYRFAWGLNAQDQITQLLVYHDGRQVQRLNLCHQGEPVQHNDEVGGLTTADFDFDNHPDIAMVISAQGEKKFCCVWLFDPQTQSFLPSEELSQIPNPAPDTQTKTIVSFVKKEGCAGGCFEQTDYAWAGGHLKPVKSVEQNLNAAVPPTVDCRFVRTFKEEKSGRLVETHRELVDTGGNVCYVPHR